MTPPWHTPRTWKPGDVRLTAPGLNHELRDLLVYLKDNLAGTPTVEAWIAPTLINSWADYGSPEAPAGYCIDPLGFVHLRGSIAGGTSGSVAFVLPSGYRPAERCRISVTAHGGYGNVRIDTSGDVRASDDQAAGVTVDPSLFQYVALDGSFRID